MTDNPWKMWYEAAITTEPIPHRLALMYRTFNRDERHKCGDCAHLLVHAHGEKRYFKCQYYKMSCGAATDWRKKWVACGKWEKKDD